MVVEKNGGILISPAEPQLSLAFPTSLPLPPRAFCTMDDLVDAYPSPKRDKQVCSVLKQPDIKDFGLLVEHNN